MSDTTKPSIQDRAKLFLETHGTKLAIGVLVLVVAAVVLQRVL